jgi:hypothetical protein
LTWFDRDPIPIGEKTTPGLRHANEAGMGFIRWLLRLGEGLSRALFAFGTWVEIAELYATDMSKSTASH